jgi:hypothetical protein
MKISSEFVKDAETLLGIWVQKYNCKLISKNRVLPTAIIASQLFERGASDQIFAFGSSTLWLFGVDRWFDEKQYANQDVAKKFSFLFDLQNIVPQDNEELEILSTFKDIQLFLSKFESFKFWRDYWFSSLLQVLFLGMASERSNNSSLSFEQYLYYGRESIGVKFVNLSTFLSMGIPLDLNHFVYFDLIQNLSAEIIRLKNDIVTNPKEFREGKLNSLSVLKATQADPTDFINSVIITKQEELFALVQRGPRELDAFSAYVKQLVISTLAFYDQSDFYDKAADLKQKHIREQC